MCKIRMSENWSSSGSSSYGEDYAKNMVRPDVPVAAVGEDQFRREIFSTTFYVLCFGCFDIDSFFF